MKEGRLPGRRFRWRSICLPIGVLFVKLYVNMGVYVFLKV